MTAREILRRVAIWVVAAGFVVVAAWMLIVQGDPFLLFGWSGFSLVGAMILTARPGNNVGRSLLAVGALWLLVALALLPLEIFGDALSPAIQGLLSIVGGIAGFFSFFCLNLVVLLFPSGRLHTIAGRVIAWFIAAMGAVVIIGVIFVPAEPGSVSSPWAIPQLASVAAQLTAALNIAILLPLTAALIDLSVRWRRASGVERLQYRWLAYGTGVVVFVFAVDQLLQTFAADAYDWITPLSWIPLALINAIPVTIGIAITRHGLFEINRIVSRTVAYTVVTVGALGVYTLVVTSATWLIPDAPSIAVAAATLIAAALFLPVLRRVQRVVDRRFDRERYDAARIVDAFGERLRTEVDPAATTIDLAGAVDKTLQPKSLGLWLRGGVQ